MKEDLRIAARMLTRERGLAAAAVLSVALGVGGNTAIFSIVNGVLLRPLPFPEPERLVSVSEVLGVVAKQYPVLPVNAWHYSCWRDRAKSFENVAAVDAGSTVLTGAGEPEQLDSMRVTANLFDTLRVRAALGRTFAGGEDQEGSARTVVISHALWRRRFGVNPEIIGRVIHLDNLPHTVIGVLPPGFRFSPPQPGEIGAPAAPRAVDVYRPLVFSREELAEQMGRFNYLVVGRLKAGVASEQAKSELNVIAGQLESESKQTVGLAAAVTPLLAAVTGNSRRPLFLLLAAVGAVLLIACLNLASLFLARAERRSAELAIRIALGASRWRLMRQALAEGAVLSILGGALGVALAAFGLRSLLALAPAELPRLEEVSVDVSVLLFAAGLSLATGVVFASGTVLRILHADPNENIRSGGRNTVGSGRSEGRMRQALIAGEVGVSVVLLTVAMLLTVSFAGILEAGLGFDAPGVVVTDIQIPRDKYRAKADRDRFYERLIAHLESQPGVASAAIVSALPFTGQTWVDGVSFEGDSRPVFERPSANIRFASPAYFRTLGLPLVHGRAFSPADRGRKVAVISESFAARLWPGKPALGRKLMRENELLDVIGVAKDVRAEAGKPAPHMVYRPDWDWSPSRVKLVVRPMGAPETVAGTIREAVRTADPAVPVQRLATMHDLFDDAVAQRRLQTMLLGVFAALALLIAGIGIYGVVAYNVTRRTREMGLRIALGAKPGHLYSLLIGQSLRPVAAGLALGVPAALAASKTLASLLYEVRPDNPGVLAAVPLILLAVAVAAAFIPVRRVAFYRPLDTLRLD